MQFNSIQLNLIQLSSIQLYLYSVYYNRNCLKALFRHAEHDPQENMHTNEREYMSDSWANPETSCLTCRIWSGGWICLASMWGCMSCIHSSSCSIHVGFFLEFPNVFLVSDSFIPKPVGNLNTQTKGYSLFLKIRQCLWKIMAAFRLHGLKRQVEYNREPQP